MSPSVLAAPAMSALRGAAALPLPNRAVPEGAVTWAVAPSGSVYRRLLCAVDATPCSRAALAHARALASVHGARLDAIHVWERPHAFGPDPMEGVGGIDEHALLDDAALAAAASLRTSLGGALDGVSALHTRAGDAASEIAAFAAETHTDLIVVGAHERSGLLRWFSGSVEESLLSSAPCPVLVVRTRAAAERPY